MEGVQVSAAIIVREGRYLITRRKADAHLAGLWEFPGGKREPGERLEDCLRRELREELGIEVTPPSRFRVIRHEYPEKTVELHFYLCSIRNGQPRALGCEELRWVTAEELSSFEFPPADRSLIEALQEESWGMQFPIEARLKDGSPIQLVLAGEQDVEPLRRLYRVIVEEGTSYPHDRVPDHEDVLDYWFRGRSTVAVYSRDGETDEMLGAFYLKPNWPGRARQVANAGFIVAPAWRNKGLGWLLGATMLEYARSLGYRSVIFNLVFSENQPARHLWRKLGFSELGAIPGAVRKNDGTYQDAIIMFRSLEDKGV